MRYLGHIQKLVKGRMPGLEGLDAIDHFEDVCCFHRVHRIVVSGYDEGRQTSCREMASAADATRPLNNNLVKSRPVHNGSAR